MSATSFYMYLHKCMKISTKYKTRHHRRIFFYLVKYTNAFFFFIIAYLLSLENLLVLAFLNISSIFYSYFDWSNRINLRSYAIGIHVVVSCKKENKHGIIFRYTAFAYQSFWKLFLKPIYLYIDQNLYLILNIPFF